MERFCHGAGSLGLHGPRAEVFRAAEVLLTSAGREIQIGGPDVMQHLDVLQRSGLVRSEKVGRVRRCRLEPGPMRTLEQWIADE